MTPPERERWQQEGLWGFDGTELEFARATLPIEELLAQLSFSILEDDTDGWKGSVPAATVVRIASMAAELELHLKARMPPEASKIGKDSRAPQRAARRAEKQVQMSAQDWARHYAVGKGRLEKALSRARMRRGDGWIESASPRRNEPRYLYSQQMAEEVFRRMRPSDKVSDECPSTGIPSS